MSVLVWVHGEGIGVNKVVTHREEPHNYGTGHVAELRGPALENGTYDPERTWARVLWDNGGWDWLRALELGLVDVAKLENARRPD